MKTLFLSLLMILAGSAFADNNNNCVPGSAVVCTISLLQPNMHSCNYIYVLRTTYQEINSISTPGWLDTESQCHLYSEKDSTAAITKLRTQAKQLVDAGVCKTVIDNLSSAPIQRTSQIFSDEGYDCYAIPGCNGPVIYSDAQLPSICETMQAKSYEDLTTGMCTDL